MANIARLLNKKGWTGRELGIIELTNFATQAGQIKRGEPLKPLVTDAQLKQMVQGLGDPAQGRIYNGYCSLHNWIVVIFNMAETQLQQAQLSSRMLEGAIHNAILAEDVFSFVAKLPLIMTQKQYDELKAERIEASFKDAETGEELYLGIFNLIERAVGFYLKKLRDEPNKPNPLKAIRKKYSAEPVKSRLVLDRYNRIAGLGYYTLEDGRRSDEMTAEEWQEAITTPKMRKALTAMRATDGSGDEYTREIAYRRLIARSRVIFEGGTEEEAAKAQRKADFEAGLAVPVEWHYYTDPPEDLTKWDIIEDSEGECGLLFYYPVDLDESGDAWNEDNFLASMRDFYAEFPELVDAMLKDISKKYFTADGKDLTEIPIEKWQDFSVSQRELYEMDFYGEKAEVESDVSIFLDGSTRAIFNGIAIVRPSDLMRPCVSSCIDENGYYKEPEIETSLENFSLEGYFTDAEDYANNADAIETMRKSLLDSYYFLVGHNYAIDRIAEIYGVPELEVFKEDLEQLGRIIDAFNNLVPLLYRRIKDTEYTDKERKEKKLKVLKDFFQPIDYKALKLPEEIKPEIEELLRDFKAFKSEYSDQFFALLYRRPESEGEL